MQSDGLLLIKNKTKQQQTTTSNYPVGENRLATRLDKAGQDKAGQG